MKRVILTLSTLFIVAIASAQDKTPWQLNDINVELRVKNIKSSVQYFIVDTNTYILVKNQMRIDPNHIQLTCPHKVTTFIKPGGTDNCLLKPGQHAKISLVPAKWNFGAKGTYYFSAA